MVVRVCSYQKQGVNWLAFLNKYKLHGILADEMYDSTHTHTHTHTFDWIFVFIYMIYVCVYVGDWVRRCKRFVLWPAIIGSDS
jgi:hypothetical protein